MCLAGLIPACSSCNYSLVQLSSLIQQSRCQGCISHDRGVKAARGYVLAPSKPVAAQREQWRRTLARRCQEMDVWPGMWQGREGRVGLWEQDRDLCLQRKLKIPGDGFGPSSTAKCRWGWWKVTASARPSGAAGEDASEVKGSLKRGGCSQPPPSAHIYSSSLLLCSG